METDLTYLIDIDPQEREPLAAWRLFAGNIGGLILQKLGIPWPAGWCLLRLEVPSGLRAEQKRFLGDIDVIAGRITSESQITTMSERNRFVWWIKQMANGRRLFRPEQEKVVI